MRLRSLAFMDFEGCPIFFRDDLIKYAHVGFNSKLHLPLAKLSTTIVKIGPLEKRYLVPWLEFVTINMIHFLGFIFFVQIAFCNRRSAHKFVVFHL